MKDALKSSSRRNSRGSLLIEVMAATMILGIIASVAYAPFMDGQSTMLNSIARDQAFTLAQQMVEYYKAMGYADMHRVGNATYARDVALDALEDTQRITVNHTTYLREMEFPNQDLRGFVREPYDSADGWYYLDTFTFGGIQRSQRLRSIDCIVSWGPPGADGRRGNKYITIQASVPRSVD